MNQMLKILVIQNKNNTIHLHDFVGVFFMRILPLPHEKALKESLD